MIQFSDAATRAKSRLRCCSTVLLDRDGTINVKAPDGQYVTSPSDLVLIPGAASAVSRFNAARVSVILVTNQRWLAYERRNEARYMQVHARLEELLAAEGAHLDAAYHCPHISESCGCRKPKPGLLRRAAMERRFDLSAAVMIGDQGTDVEAARAAGAVSIFLSSGQRVVPGSADFIAHDLAEAAQLILGSQ